MRYVSMVALLLLSGCASLPPIQPEYEEPVNLIIDTVVDMIIQELLYQ